MMLTSRDVLVLCVCFISIHSVLSCSYDRPDRRARCSSFDLVHDVGHQPHWWRLNVFNQGDGIWGPIKKNSFINIPNLIDIQVSGLATGIEKGAFNGLSKLFELHLDDNRIEIIPSYAFVSDSMEVLFIYNCQVENIQPRAFNGLPKLKKLDLFGNRISTIEAGVFTGLTIEFLKLWKCGIKNVKENAFGDMKNLNWLSLEENKLISFEPQLAIGYNPTLASLLLMHNKLTDVSRRMFSGLPSLQVLLLHFNSIERFGDYSFHDLKQLRHLEVSYNHLEEIQANVFNPRGMKELKLLYIHENEISFLSPELLARMPKLEKMYVGGNPWQCPCWELLDSYLGDHNIERHCYDMYVKGGRPFCASSNDSCIYDLKKAADFPKRYEELTKIYGPPTKC